jgi:hypothetical protein
MTMNRRYADPCKPKYAGLSAFFDQAFQQLIAKCK